MKFAAILFGLLQLLRVTAWRYPAFRARLTDAARHVLQAKARAGLLTC